MAALSAGTRQAIARAVMRHWSRLREGTPYLKAELQAAVNAADDWADANGASYNSALPVAFRNNASASQKALLLAAVIAARAGVEWLRALLGQEA